MTTEAPHVLAVDDDAALRDAVVRYLAENDLRATAVGSGLEMDDVLAHEMVDCVLLDLKLPGEDGLAIARRLRKQGAMPILMLTARGEVADRVMGLELGADDYLTKPFALRELLSRIRALLRRVAWCAGPAERVGKPRALRFEDWELDLRQRRLKGARGEEQVLPHGEFALLTALLTSPQKVLSRSGLMARFHEYEDGICERSIDVQILRLRRRLEADPTRPKLILTRRGEGYLFAAPVLAL